MTDDQNKPPKDSPEALRRYQRMGGTARKDEPRGGLWQRVRNWVGKPEEDDESLDRLREEDLGPQPPSSSEAPPMAQPPATPPPAPLAVPTPTAPTSAAAPTPAAPSPTPSKAEPSATPGPERLAVELVLPDEQRLVLLVSAPRGRSGGLLHLRVEPAPANDPRIVEGLSIIGHGEVIEEPRRLRPSAEMPPLRPSAEMPPVRQAGLSAELPPVGPSTEMPPVQQAGPSTEMPPVPPQPSAETPATEAPASPDDDALDLSKTQPIRRTGAAAAVAQKPATPVSEALPPMEPMQAPPSSEPAEIELPPAGQRKRQQTGDTLMGVGLSPPTPEPAPELVPEPTAEPTPEPVPEPSAPLAAEPTVPMANDQAPQPTADAESPKRKRLRPAAARGGAAEAMFGEETGPEAEPQGQPVQPQAQAAPSAPAPAPAAPAPAPPAPAPPPPAQSPSPPPPGPAPAVRPEPRSAPQPEPATPPEPEDLYPASAQSLGQAPADQARAPLFPPNPEEPQTPAPAPASSGDFRTGLKSSQLPIVGIDFGTSYSSIALMRAGLEIIPDENGDPLLPSVISFPKASESLIGWDARKRMGGEAQFTIVSPKRLLGRLYKDPQVAQMIGGLAFRTFAGTDKFVRFEAHGEIYSVTDICAMILGRLRERACRYLDAEVSKAVFAVPVGFGTLQRSALEVAARKAGLEPVGLVTEPSAAVLAHGFRQHRGVAVVYDFGGGTFDFSVLEVSETAFQVLCAGGDPWLGGDDFDNAMASHLADRFWKETGVDLRNRAVEWQALLFACEQAKRILSKKNAAEVRVDNLLHTSKGAKGLRYKLSRKEFVKLVNPLIEKSVSISTQVMTQAGLTPDQVDAVVVTGGTSMIPAVRDAVTQCFKRKPIEGDPDLAVVRGASLRAAELAGEAVAETSMGGRTLKEVAGRTIGAGPKGGRVVTLFERDTPVPAEVFKAFYTQLDNQTEMVIGLYEESKSRVDESRTIGHLRYKGLRNAPAGQARIDFTFVLDEDGILHVTALVEGKEYTKSIRLS